MVFNTLATIPIKTAGIGAIDRIQSLDFTKGILVLIMVLYHSMNYIHPGPLAYTYLGFLAPSFVMITGFIITQIYLPRYGPDIKSFMSRITVRSIKLLFLFTFLNLMYRILLPQYHCGIASEIEYFFWDWLQIYLIGSPWTVAFEVLLPISYTLLLSIFVPMLRSLATFAIPGLAIATFSISLLMAHYGIASYNMMLIGFGVSGMAFGLIPMSLINRCVGNGFTFSLLVLLYGCCFFLWGYNDYTRIILTIISLLVIDAIGVRMKSKQWVTRQTVLLGKYSLFCYVIQILYLRIFIQQASWHFGQTSLILTVIIITIMMWSSVLIVERMRRKYAFLNNAYQRVFG